MLSYTGHPFVDVGLATIAAFNSKRKPEELSDQDLNQVSDYITREYVRQPLRSFLTVVFPNSGFTQPAFFNAPERQLDYADRVLRSYSSEMAVLDERCVFTGDPAVAVAFGDKEGLPLGRAFRQHVPLTTGEDVVNFHPYGDSGLPVSGKAMLAIQAFPLGCAKVAGRLLIVHSDNPELTLHFARTFLTENRKAVQLAQAANSSKMPEPNLRQRTLLIETLLEADMMRVEAQQEQRPFTVTAYHLSNSGQGPGLDIYHLPMQTIRFLREMEKATYRGEWHKIVRRAWEVPAKDKEGKRNPDQIFQPTRNWLYEDLFDLPDNATHFIRTYFLRIALKYARDKTDPRQDYSLAEDVNLVSWKITAKFLGRILNMDGERIEQIREVADRLAGYVSSQNDKRFFRNFFTEQNYDYFRTALLKVNLAHVSRGNPPIVTFDPYIHVFEEGTEVARRDWRLARDLVLIRMIEQLHQMGWLGQNQEVITEMTTEQESK
jgi:CRISPR-associated protein Cst1